jgi:hypothetical protein
MKLTDKGQCPVCLIKPLRYKRDGGQHYCHRCCRAFNLETGQQIPNWAWLLSADGEFAPRHPGHDYATTRAAT